MLQAFADLTAGRVGNLLIRGRIQKNATDGIGMRHVGVSF